MKLVCLFAVLLALCAGAQAATHFDLVSFLFFVCDYPSIEPCIPTAHLAHSGARVLRVTKLPFGGFPLRAAQVCTKFDHHLRNLVP